MNNEGCCRDVPMSRHLHHGPPHSLPTSNLHSSLSMIHPSTYSLYRLHQTFAFRITFSNLKHISTMSHLQYNPRPRRFASLNPSRAEPSDDPQLKGIVFDVDGTLWCAFLMSKKTPNLANLLVSLKTTCLAKCGMHRSCPGEASLNDICSTSSVKP